MRVGFVAELKCKHLANCKLFKPHFLCRLYLAKLRQLASFCTEKASLALSGVLATPSCVAEAFVPILVDPKNANLGFQR